MPKIVKNAKNVLHSVFFGFFVKNAKNHEKTQKMQKNDIFESADFWETGFQKKCMPKSLSRRPFFEHFSLSTGKIMQENLTGTRQKNMLLFARTHEKKVDQNVAKKRKKSQFLSKKSQKIEKIAKIAS